MIQALLNSAPWWAWAGFHVLVFAMLALDLGAERLQLQVLLAGQELGGPIDGGYAKQADDKNCVEPVHLRGLRAGALGLRLGRCRGNAARLAPGPGRAAAAALDVD